MSTTTVQAIPFENRAFRDSFIFHASQGNTLGVGNLAQMRDDGRNLLIPMPAIEQIFFQIREFLEYQKTPENRNVFKKHISDTLQPTSTVLPQESTIFKTQALLEHIFSFLDIHEIAKAGRTCLDFHKKATHSLTYVLNAKTSYTYSALVACQKAYHVDSVTEFLELFPEKMASIKELDLSVAPITADDLASLLSFMPNLARIDLSCLSYSGIQAEIPIELLANSCPKLTYIKLAGRNNLTDQSLELLVDKFPNLSVIDLSFCATLMDVSLKPFAKCTSLTELYLGGCNNLTDAAVCTIIENNPGLRRVYFGCFSNMPSLVISTLTQHCPHLESINPGVTDPSIRLLARYCPKVCFTYATDETLFIEQKKLDRYRKELDYKPISVLGQLYSSLLKESLSESLAISIKSLKDDDFLNRIYFHMWQLSDQPDELDWGKNHALDEDKRDVLIKALEIGILEHFNRLSHADKNRVYGKVYDLSPDHDEVDRQWGENHALENLARLADATQ